ncbi:hypothetical protein ETD83_05590 [Actinomadura soli]|uniref:Ricin-type beta-trefoil lectin protein n=1 Tax=Actinomadura soli TaxID=2508997 RepID=A0A5C4JHI1_9ACTN|nr:hypothetical protein [Actinomadura soli]TMR05712.1 hypothetical protein ETD83_05590 [Actinomadura soli]
MIKVGRRLAAVGALAVAALATAVSLVGLPMGSASAGPSREEKEKIIRGFGHPKEHHLANGELAGSVKSKTPSCKVETVEDLGPAWGEVNRKWAGGRNKVMVNIAARFTYPKKASLSESGYRLENVEVSTPDPETQDVWVGRTSAMGPQELKGFCGLGEPRQKWNVKKRDDGRALIEPMTKPGHALSTNIDPTEFDRGVPPLVLVRRDAGGADQRWRLSGS